MKKRDIIKGWYQANRRYFKELFERRKIHRSPKHLELGSVYEAVHRDYDPCFVLSTGRCGTRLLTQILEAHPEVSAFHVPMPELTFHNKFAYENQYSKSGALEHMIDVARYEYIRNTFLLEKKFVETNNRCTFFAPQLAKIYPNSKFIHLVRNPHSVVKSGVSRGWYSGEKLHDESRIVPLEEPTKSDWKQFQPFEKNAWLWNETNHFAENFKSTIDASRVLTVKAEDIFSAAATSDSIFQFLGLEPLTTAKMRRLLKPTNTTKKSKLSALTNEQKSRITEIATVAKKYNY